jgi:hypothetical protein
MDLLQKHGHLKHDHRKSTAQKEETEQRHQQTQQGMFLSFSCVHVHVNAGANCSLCRVQRASREFRTVA